MYLDRHDAGKKLALSLTKYADATSTLVVGLARGGVETAHEVALVLKLPLDVLVVRKIGAPGNEELALGAISETGEAIFNKDIISLVRASPEYLNKIIERERKTAEARSALYRGKKAAPEYKNRTIILVDDGIATGASMEVAIQSMRKAGAKKIVLAVPVAAPDSLRRLGKLVDEVVCPLVPSDFEAVGSFYQRFGQTSDEEVIRLLRAS
jgi:putative phosphoribosyl transferase